MAIAVLSVQQRGTAQSSNFVRMAGVVASSIGPNFSVSVVTAIVGVFVVGETIQGTTSLATAKITGLMSGGRFALSNLVGTFINAETIVGLTSLATGTQATPAILEQSAAFLSNMGVNRVLNYRNRLFGVLNAFVWTYNGTDWVVAHAFSTPPGLASDSNSHGGLNVFYVNNQPKLGVLYGWPTDGNVRRATSSDGVVWSEALLAADYFQNFAGPGGAGREVKIGEVLYMLPKPGTGPTTHAAWNPATDSFQMITVPGITGPNTAMGDDLMVYKNLLLKLSSTPIGFTRHEALFSFSGGVWSLALAFTAEGNIDDLGTPYNTCGSTLFDPGDGFVYCVYFSQNLASQGWIIKKLSYSAGIFTNLGNVQVAVLAGTGIPTYPVGPNTIGGRFFVVVDDVTVPGTLSTYLYFTPDDAPGSTCTVMQWNGPAAAVTILGAGGDAANVLPHSRSGGGERLWGPAQPDILITDVQSVPGGERLYYILYGGGTRNVQFWFGQTGQAPLIQCTLLAPSTGTLDIGLKQVNGVPANGVTVNEVTWNAGPSGDNAPNLVRTQIEPVAI